MSRPLNFLHFSTFYPPYSFGGDAMYLYRLCHALGDEGHQVDVVHCLDSYHLLHPAEPEIQFAPHPNVKTYALSSGFKWLSPLLTHQSGRPWLKNKRIHEVLNSKPYDVIHFHNISLLGPQVLTLEPGSGSAVKLYTTHEHWLICPTHVLWKFNRRPCESPQCLRCTLMTRRPPQLWRTTDLLAKSSKHIDQFISPSRFTAQMHTERGFPQPVGHLPYFTEKADDDWENPGARPQERPYFLFVGRLEEIKGLQILIKLWDKVLDCDLLVAGAGSYVNQLHALAANNTRIKFLGPLSQRELGRLYAHALACLVPSIVYETFGIIIIEAFARKTPVIAHDLGGLAEVVRDSGGGFVYRTEEEFLSAIHRLATEPDQRRELGELGYQAFIRWWTKEAHLKLYFELLRETAIKKFGFAPWE